MRFTLKQLEYFVAAAQCNSIKQAAEEISISQPSISAAITHLEQELGVQLFVRRHAQGLSLTASGKRLLRETKLLFRQAECLYAVADELRHDLSGPLSVGCLVTLAPVIFPQLARSFALAHPQVKLTMSEGNPKRLLEDLHEISIDIAVSYDLQVPDDVLFEPLAELPPRVLVGANHPFAKRGVLSLEELAQEAFVLLDLPYSRQYFLGLFQSAGLKPNVAAQSQNHEVVKSLVANGFGFTIANVRPMNLVALDGQPMVSIGLSGDHTPMTIGMATLRQQHKPKILQAFERHCREKVSDKSIPGMRLDH